MATAFVQGTGLQSTGSVASLSKAFASNVTAGNLIVIGIVGNVNLLATFTGTPPSDTPVNSYTQRIRNTRQNTSTEIWYAKNINGGACTVTVTPSPTALVSLGIAEASGADTTAPAGNTGVGSNVSSAAPATGSVTIATSGEIMFGLVAHDGATVAITPGIGWNQIFEDEDSTEMPFNYEYELLSANDTADWTTGSAVPWCCVAASFKAAAGASDTLMGQICL